MHAIILIAFLIVGLGILCWLVSVTPLPPMIKNLIWALLALASLVVMWNMVGGGGSLTLRS
jgi:tellurite resistance protein TehA-like permease